MLQKLSISGRMGKRCKMNVLLTSSDFFSPKEHIFCFPGPLICQGIGQELVSYFCIRHNAEFVISIQHVLNEHASFYVSFSQCGSFQALTRVACLSRFLSDPKPHFEQGDLCLLLIMTL